MTNELGTAVLKLKTDDSEFNAGINRAHDKAGVLGLSLDRVSNIAGGMLARDVIREGFSRFQELLGSTIDSANESAKVQAQLAAAVKSTGGAAGESVSALNSQAKALQDQTTYSDEAVGSAQALLLTFTDIKSNIFPQTTQTVLDMATAMHEDLQSAAIQVGKALQDPILGATALRRVGVQLSDSQQELVKHLVETGDKLGAQKIILEELNREFGGSAAAQVDTYAGRMAQLSNKIDDVKEEIGFLLEGGIMTLMDYLEEHADDIVDFIDKWRQNLAPLGDFVETQIGGIIQMFTSVYKTIADVVDLVDSVIHGDWASAWEDAKDIPTQLMAAFVGNIARLFGTIPDIMISAVEAGVNGVIDILNSIPEIKTPGLNLGPLGKVGSQTLFGGFDIGHVDLPRLNLPTADLGAFFDTAVDGANKLIEKGKMAQPEVDALGTAYSDSGDAAKKATGDVKSLGETLQDALGKIRSVAGALFAQPTREMATLQAQVDKFQQSADQIRIRLQPSIDALTGLKDSIKEAADREKELIQARKDSIDAEKEVLDNLNEQLAQQGDALDEMHRQRQEAIRAAFEGPKILTPEEQALAQDDAAYQAAKKALADQQKSLERQQKALDENAKALDKMSRGIDTDTAKQTKLIDQQISGLQKQIDSADKLVKSTQDQIKLLEDQHKVMQDNLTLADQTLLTEDELQKAVDTTQQRVKELTQATLDMVDGVKTKLIPGFDELVAAGGPLDLVKQNMSDAAGAAGGAAGAMRDMVKAMPTPDMWQNVVQGLNASTGYLIALGSQTANPNARPVETPPEQPMPWYEQLIPHASGGFFDRPQAALIGDAPGGEWLFTRGQLTSLIREVTRTGGAGGGDTIVVQGSILAERELMSIVRDTKLGGGFRKVVD